MQQSFRSTKFQLRRAKDRRAFNQETQVNPPCWRRSIVHTSLIAGATLALPKHLLASTSVAKPDFLVADYYVHLRPQLSIEQAVKLGKDRQVGIGILEHPGPGYKIQNDGDLTQYLYPAWAARGASSVAALS